MRYLNYAICLLPFFIANELYSQKVIEGKVIDSITEEPLAFVHIVTNSQSNKGYVTDINGKFSIPYNKKIQVFTLSYLGYEKKQYPVVNPGKLQIIPLKPISFNLKEVIVRPGKNPALVVMKKALRNIEKNNPGNFPPFSCNAYNKTIVDFNVNKEKLADSAYKEHKDYFKTDERHFLITEKVSKKFYKNGKMAKEEIEAQRVSGFSDPDFSAFVTEVQPFHFYDPLVKLYENYYINPLSKAGLSNYTFVMKDTLTNGPDSIFIIEFMPSSLNKALLEGSIHIHSAQYAIKNVIAKPYIEELMALEIKQSYKEKNHQMLPSELSYELILKKYPSPKVGLKFTSISSLSGYQLKIDDSLLRSTAEPVVVYKKKSKADSILINRSRPKPLDLKEKTTYVKIDSIGKAHNFDGKLRFLNKVTLDKIPFGFFDLDITKIQQNKYQGMVLGPALYTNERISKNFSIGGFYTRSFKIKENNWGTSLKISPFENKETFFKAYYRYEHQEPGQYEFVKKPRKYFRKWMVENMYRIEEKGFELVHKIPYTNIELQMNRQTIGFDSSANTTDFEEFALKIRFAYKENIVKSFNYKIRKSDYPILYLNFSSSDIPFLHNRYQYNKLLLALEYELHNQKLGITEFWLEGGTLIGEAPYYKLFYGKGTSSKYYPLFIKHKFQSMGMYNYAGSEFFHVFINHKPVKALYYHKFSEPKPVITHSMGWGNQNAMKEMNLPVKEYSKGYFENGLVVKNVLKVNYFNFFFMGLGAGAFYHYGEYSRADFQENLTYKLSFNILF